MLDPRANGSYGTSKASQNEAKLGLSGRKPARKKRQPQEGQHSAASWRDAGPTAVARPVNKAPERGTVIATPECDDGGARGRVPPASDTFSDFTTCWYQFCFCGIVSVVCMSMHDMRATTEPIFQRTTWQRKRRRQRRARKLPRRWQRRRRGRSNDEKVLLRIRSPDLSSSLQGSERGLYRASDIEETKEIGPLRRRRRLHKGLVFLLARRRGPELFLREGSTPQGRDALAVRFHESLVREGGRAPGYRTRIKRR